MRSTLSLFNGIGTGIQALKDIGIKVGKSYISEIDKFANMTNEKNHPESIQLGDITKWREWDIDWSQVDLVTAGFPCQAWSVAGQQLGDKDPRGALFWTTLEVISHVLCHNPNAKWLMENVRMKREFEEYITLHTGEALGNVEKVLINSALVTAQNRNRYYWSNFKIGQPEDRGILLRDIVDTRLDNKFNLSKEAVKRFKPCDKKPSGQIGTTAHEGKIGQRDRVYCIDSKMITLTANMYKQPPQYAFKIGAFRGRYIVDGVRQDHKMLTAGKTTQRLELRSDDKSNTLTTVQKDNVLVFADKSQTILSTIYKENVKSMLKRNKKGLIVGSSYDHYRKLTPLECERLQGYPDNYTEGVSNTQRYKQCGNGWTLPVIAHIFKEMLCQK